ncbi:LuxR family maltose regulon positive regulatory protein [Nakamurella sp. UYEF19]|uniref:LuxR C-terminal-related transcriptional regulator n=1 Tax=Nakamurella sp. UYEF19 TaxID=1756392 RepID=UPI00339236F7
MAGALLETKFHLPISRRGVVTRSRLTEMLNRVRKPALTLVSAPAGFGKTTLLAQWLADSGAVPGKLVAWLSLDHRDNDPAVFWTYLITALHRTCNSIGAEALSLLQSPRPPMEAVLSSLINDLTPIANDVVLVLDDYHLIDAREVHEGTAFVLAHCPPQLHLVIAGRADPPLPLARMRSRGELVELRAADLRFTSGEAAAYLNDVMGLAVTDLDIQTLEGRTEGWIAALQLAALSMQGRDDVASFIAGFTGDDRYIVDYLAEEVLSRQPEKVRQFLMQTSVLERLSGPLCDAVTGRDGGQAMLTSLERGNLFLVPLDDQRRWFRYHQLFADVLQAHLLDEQPDGFPGLHRRASGWHERQGEVAEAVKHALAATDFERAADLIERAIPELSRQRQETAVRDWLQVIPDDVIGVRPVLIVGFAGALLSGGRLDGVEARLRDAERWLDRPRGISSGSGAPPADMVVADDEQFRHLPTMIELYRAALALALGDLTATVHHARKAIDLSAENHLGLASAAGLLGLASWTVGDLAAAHSAYTDCSDGLLRAGYVADTLGCAIALADIRVTQGRLGEAMRTLEHAMQRANTSGPVLPGTADMHVGLSALQCERNDLRAAKLHLSASKKLGESAGLPQNRYRWRVAMARVLEAEGDLNGALELLEEAERFYVGDFFPHVRPIPALRARLWIAQGNLTEALGWARARGLSAQDDLTYLREFEHITLATLLLVRRSADLNTRTDDEVTGFLERLRRAAEEGQRAGSVIEIAVLQALCHQAGGNSGAAITSLHHALDLAEPEGYIRVFTGHGSPMAAMLRATSGRGRHPEYVERLLAAMNSDSGDDVSGKSESVSKSLIGPLTDREMEVLRLLATDLNGPDISRRLFVSLNTVRTHTSSIYAKLGVNNRRSAVRRAMELELLSRTDDR